APRPPDPIGASATVQGVIAAATVKEVLAPRPAPKDVVALFATQVVESAAADHAVVPGSPKDNVLARLPEQAVGLLQPPQSVAARTAPEQVPPGRAMHEIGGLVSLQGLAVRVTPGRVLIRRDHCHVGVGRRRGEEHHDTYGGDQASCHRPATIPSAVAAGNTPRGKPATPALLRHRPRSISRLRCPAASRTAASNSELAVPAG